MSHGPMLQLKRSLAAWGTTSFDAVLKDEIEGLDCAALPLQQGLERSSYVTDSGFSVTVLSAADEPDLIRARIGVFYTGVVAGCSCADDPTPVEGQTEYCELQLDIEKATAGTNITLLDREAG